MAKKTEKGNALFLVLLGVVLFGILGYTLTQTSRFDTGSSMTTHQASIYASEIITYADKVANATTLVLNSGTDIADLSFANSTVSGYSHTPASAATAQVFNAAGGGLDYVAPNPAWLDSSLSAQTLYGEWYFNPSTCIAYIGTGSYTCGTTAQSDLTVFLPYVSKDVCKQIDIMLGLITSGDPPSNRNGVLWPSNMPKYTGSFFSGASIWVSAFGNTPVKAACLKDGTTSTYGFYKVLVAR